MKLNCLLFAFFLCALTQIMPSPDRGVASIKTEPTCDMLESPYPRCWAKRSTGVLNILLVHYGSEMDQKTLLEVGALYKERFALASNNTVTINLLNSIVIPLKEMERDLESIKPKIGGDDSKKYKQRLKRLWYYYQNISIGDEIYQEILKNPDQKALLKGADAVVVLSSPQIDGLAYLSGAFSLIEYPTEIAWKLSDGGSTEFENKYYLADRMVHETGHLLGIDHPSDQCNASDPKEWAKCCKESPGGEDVMSYCRPRTRVSEDSHFKFTKCTLDYMTQSSLPAMLKGEARGFQKQNCL